MFDDVKERLQGCVYTIFTPFDEQENIDYLAIDRYLEKEPSSFRRGGSCGLEGRLQPLGGDVITREPTLIMDADVVFPREFLRRLVSSAAAQAFLIDEGFADTGEEVKIYLHGDRVIALGKKVVPRAWDRIGEGIGFFKCGPEAGRELVGLLAQVIDESQGGCEYEDALHLLVSRQRVEAVDVTGLPWTEVDFAEDLHRAQSEVYPAIARLEGT